MHVAMVTDTFQTGGGQEQLFQLVKALPTIRFSVSAKGGDPRRFHRLPNAAVYASGFGRKHLLGLSPDLIHFHHLRPLVHFFSHPGAAQAPVPVLFTAQGLHVRKYRHRTGLRSRTGKLLRRALERRLFGRVDRVIAVSLEDERFLRSRYGLERVVYIPNAVDVRALEEGVPAGEGLRRELGIPPDRTLFLTVARFDFQKGYDVLLEGIRLGRQRFRETRTLFLLVGEGKERPAMQKLAAGKRLTDLVCFAGERAEAWRMMKECDLFVLPSRWEGLPVSLLEALFSKVPVVASDACGNRQIVRHGVNGLLFENGNPESLRQALEQMTDPKTRESLVPIPLDEAFRREYDIEHIRRALEGLYRKCAGRIPGPS